MSFPTIWPIIIISSSTICQTTEVSSGTTKLPKCKRKDIFDWVGLSEEDKKEILDIHNVFRRRILDGKVLGLPRAKEMKEMSWDDDLEKEATRWAKMCPKFGDGTAHPPADWKAMKYGQNVAWSHRTFASAAQAWFDEFLPYVDAGVDPLIFRAENDRERQKHGLGQIAHFTAMAHAQSDRLGCSSAGGEDYTQRVVYVCNYAPPGNLLVREKDGSLRPVPAYEAVEDEEEAKKKKNISDGSPNSRRPSFRKYGLKRRKNQGGFHFRPRKTKKEASAKRKRRMEASTRFNTNTVLGDFPTLSGWKRESRILKWQGRKERKKKRSIEKALPKRRRRRKIPEEYSLEEEEVKTKAETEKKEKEETKKDFFTRWIESILGEKLEKLWRHNKVEKR